MSEAATEKKKASETVRVRELVDRAQRGDRAALEELYLIHFDRIYSYLHVTVGNRHDAEVVNAVRGHSGRCYPRSGGHSCSSSA